MASFATSFTTFGLSDGGFASEVKEMKDGKMGLLSPPSKKRGVIATITPEKKKKLELGDVNLKSGENLECRQSQNIPFMKIVTAVVNSLSDETKVKEENLDTLIKVR